MTTQPPRSLALAALLAALAVSCAGPSDAYLKAKYAGDRAKPAGRYDEAARSYHEAAMASKSPYHRDEALYLEAATYQQAGRSKDASTAFEALAKLSPKGDRA